ncbi:MAG: hypothetical protein GXP39_00650 [Chloroflexi bacterium]|nr:hypothetical protein [Chloroflexota bacterium]
MRRILSHWSLLVMVVLLLVGVRAIPVQGRSPLGESSAPSLLGTSFTYQGRLLDGGRPASGTYDLQFRLYDAASGGNAVGSSIVKNDVVVSDGLFTVLLDFGDVFDGSALWLEVGVRPGDSTGAFTPLHPRQALTPTPYALALPGLRTRQNDTSPNVIGGYRDNGVDAGVVGATIGGGGKKDAPNSVTGSYATVSGGFANTASGVSSVIGGGDHNEASFPNATVGGGDHNTAGGWDATVSGGSGNTASGYLSTVGGGKNNTADGIGSFIGGGGYDGVHTESNQALAAASTIGGGLGNVIASTASYATIGGGWRNTASGGRATISGGEQNEATGYLATIGGGFNNIAGFRATVGGGDNNKADGSRATIGGGGGNIASKEYATVPGGSLNVAAGKYAFAAGRRAKAYRDGCFIWGDSTDDDVICNKTNQTVFRSSGGFLIYTNASRTAGVFLSTGSGSWRSLSDRNMKENVVPVDREDVLEKVAWLPISTWNYKSQDDSIRHMGPMAQDFYAAFGLGEDDAYIGTIDADGVALAAIQGLYDRNKALEGRVRALERENAALRDRVEEIEARLSTLEDRASPGQSPDYGLLPGASVLALAGALLWIDRRRGGSR